MSKKLGHKQSVAKREAESGQAVLEYILLLSITIGIMTWAVRFLTEKSDRMVGFYGANVEKQLRTGGTPPNVIWTK